MQALNFEDITSLGDLSRRMLKSFERLESPMYQCRQLYHSMSTDSWPGDWEGRTMLGLTLLSRATGRRAAYLDQEMEALPDFLNSKGYLGPILPAGEFSEQQFSGHNWLLRALIEYYHLTGKTWVRDRIQTILENLYMPALGAYARYPIQPDQRVYQGEASGSLTGACISGWHTSSDTGCAYICLDALGQAYGELGMKFLKPLLDEMVANLQRIDFVGISVQTHATLSAVRGLLRIHQADGNDTVLELAERLFDLYLEHGMSENYANHNWFDRPLWTEPCAIVDSWMAAMQLFCLTRAPRYLEIAHRIRFSALYFAQRSNGGFGCDDCVSAEHPLLAAHPGVEEAFWCCSMRGAEGLSQIHRHQLLTDGDAVLVTGYGCFAAETNAFSLSCQGAFPLCGESLLQVIPKAGAIRLGLYAPEYAENLQIFRDGSRLEPTFENGFAFVSIDAPCQLRVCFDLNLRETSDASGRMRKFFLGPVLMGVKTDVPVSFQGAPRKTADGQWMLGEYPLIPLWETLDVPMDALPNERIQVLFEK